MAMNTSCPKCGNRMLLRINKTQRSTFLGCSTYPLCRGTRNVEQPSDPDFYPKPRKRSPMAPEQSGRLSPAYEPYKDSRPYLPTTNIFAGETIMVPVRTIKKKQTQVSGVKGREERLAQE
jgi:ssDNA-binding Zn-finger/Zn-ribbon topoisomerase 1